MSFNLPIGKPVTGKNMAGRKEMVMEIEQLLKQEQSVVLIGPRRIGKTSVMLEVLGRMKKSGNFTLHTDVFLSPTLNLFAERITAGVLANRKLDQALYKLKHGVKAVFKNVELRQLVEENEFILGFAEKEENGMKLLEQSIAFMDSFSGKYRKKMIAAFDEFGDIDKYNGGSVAKLFRAQLQLMDNTVCLFSGSYESVMNELFVTRKSPFFRFARIIQIGPIEEDILRKYTEAKLREAGIEVVDNCLENLLQTVEGHPYYLQLGIQQLIIGCAHKGTATKKDMQSAIANMFFSESGYLHKCWEELIGRKENIPVLIALASPGKHIYTAINSRKINVARSLKNLANAGMVAKNSEGYYLTDPLLKRWIYDNFTNKT